MSLKFKFIAFISVLHIVILVLIYFVLKDRLWYFIGSEVLVFISIFLSYLLYQSFIRPMSLLQSGTDAIADKDFSIMYLETGSSDVDKLVRVYNEMITKLREERTLLTEQSYFIQKLIEVTPLGIIIMDYDGNISNINPSAKKILGLKSEKSLVGTNLVDHDTLLNQITTSELSSQTEIINHNGIDRYKVRMSEVIHQGFRRKFILIDDLSVEIVKVEKEAYGKIIRMMAHEVNNSMGAVNSILDTVIEFGFQNGGDEELRESLLTAKNRNIGLSEFMANYAELLRLPKPNRKRINLSELLRKTGQLFVPRALEKGIEVIFNLGDREVNMTADPVLLEQAISNMLKNAIEAIEEGGEIKISCNANPVQFVISDNGTGIDDDVYKRLFTPFFSTKTTGQGVGLMLIKEVLQSHEAEFRLYSENNWTHFEVSFPSERIQI